METNFFAAQLLMPEQLLRELQRRGVSIKSVFLQEKFGVSKQAADKRIETLAKTDFEWRSRAEDVVGLIDKFGGLPIGTEGTIVLEYDGRFFEVEFFDSNGDTIDVLTTPAEVLELVTPN